MTPQEIEQQPKPLILATLRITDVRPDEFGDSQPLLDGGLEIDSIAAILAKVEERAQT